MINFFLENLSCWDICSNLPTQATIIFRKIGGVKDSVLCKQQISISEYIMVVGHESF
jgi:hypothetical protein